MYQNQENSQETREQELPEQRKIQGDDITPEGKQWITVLLIAIGATLGLTVVYIITHLTIIMTGFVIVLIGVIVADALLSTTFYKSSSNRLVSGILVLILGSVDVVLSTFLSLEKSEVGALPMILAGGLAIICGARFIRQNRACTKEPKTTF